MWWYALAVPEAKKWRQKDQAFMASIINTDFEANLDYRRPVLNATKSTNETYFNNQQVMGSEQRPDCVKSTSA